MIIQYLSWFTKWGKVCFKHRVLLNLYLSSESDNVSIKCMNNELNTCSQRQWECSSQQQLQIRKLPTQPEMWFDFKTFFQIQILIWNVDVEDLAGSIDSENSGGSWDPHAEESVQLSHLTQPDQPLNRRWVRCFWWMNISRVFCKMTFTLMVDINPLALIQSVTMAADTHTMLWIWNTKVATPQTVKWHQNRGVWCYQKAKWSKKPIDGEAKPKREFFVKYFSELAGFVPNLRTLPR